MTSYHRGCSVVEGEGSSCFKLREIYFATTKLEVLLFLRILEHLKTRYPNNCNSYKLGFINWFTKYNNCITIFSSKR